MRLRRRGVAALLALLLLVLLLFVFRERILWSMGQSLVNDGPPQKADLVVVMGGDWRGNRVLKAAALASAGYAPKVLIGGAFGFFGHHESEYAAQFAVERGYPRAEFIPFTFPANSTLDEAEHDTGLMRTMGVRKILLVTDPWHTARAVRIFHNVAPDIEVHAVSCVDKKWMNGFWWRSREGRKVWFMEELKTVAYWLGI